MTDRQTDTRTDAEQKKVTSISVWHAKSRRRKNNTFNLFYCLINLFYSFRLVELANVSLELEWSDTTDGRTPDKKSDP